MLRMYAPTAAILASLLAVACSGRSGTAQPGGKDGTVGTTGRTGNAGTVGPALAGEPPVFVGRDRESQQLWTLTKQFYQKRGETSAWIEGGKPRKQMDDL